MTGGTVLAIDRFANGGRWCGRLRVQIERGEHQRRQTQIERESVLHGHLAKEGSRARWEWL